MDQLFKKIIRDYEQTLNPNDEQVYMINRRKVKAILLDKIAFDPSATAIVWTLAELLSPPSVLKDLQRELHSVIGKDRMLEKSNLPKLDYLEHSGEREGLDLHTVGPLPIPQ